MSRKERNTMTDAQPRQFSTDWFEGHVDNWQRWLGAFAGRPGLRALEIGSFEGRSTVWMLEHILTAADSRIDCIDLFEPAEVYGDYPARFLANTAPWRERITMHAGRSFEMLRQVRGPYHIVYIDGWHSAFGALADGVMSWPLLKVGGVMIFDDYLWIPLKYGRIGRPNKLVRELSNLFGRDWRRAAAEAAIAKVPTETPKLGVDGLLRTLDGHYELLGDDYQLAIRKTSDFGSAVLGIDT
jgi:predicted O-methyltransferase YrrM